MKVSKRVEYALRALIDLGLAERLGRPLVQVRELSEKERLPRKFLEQILGRLKQAGFVKGLRGKGGGYVLAKRPEEVIIGDVLRLMDGPLAPIRCVSRTAYRRCSCPDELHCGLRILMDDVRAALSRILDGHTLADVVDVTLRKLRRDGVSGPITRLVPPPRAGAGRQEQCSGPECRGSVSSGSVEGARRAGGSASRNHRRK